MQLKNLTWLATVPSRPGLYIRTFGEGPVSLMLVSIERFLGGSRHAYLTEVTADFVRGPLSTPIRESMHYLRGDTKKTRAMFLGPIKLPRVPSQRALERASRALPNEPGVYYVSRNLGHAWLHTVTAVSVHRYTSIHRYTGIETPKDELFAFDLPCLEPRNIEAEANDTVFTMALPHHRRLNLQELPAA